MLSHLSVNHSVHMGWACVAAGACMAGGRVWQGGICGRGVCVVGEHVWQGDMRGRRGACVAGGHAWQGAYVAGHGRRDGHYSGRYASYWNALLWFITVSVDR